MLDYLCHLLCAQSQLQRVLLAFLQAGILVASSDGDFQVQVVQVSGAFKPLSTCSPELNAAVLVGGIVAMSKHRLCCHGFLLVYTQSACLADHGL